MVHVEMMICVRATTIGVTEKICYMTEAQAVTVHSVSVLLKELGWMSLPRVGLLMHWPSAQDEGYAIEILETVNASLGSQVKVVSEQTAPMTAVGTESVSLSTS